MVSHMKTKSTVVHIPNELHKRLKAIAIKKGMKLEALSTQAVQKFLQEEK